MIGAIFSLTNPSKMTVAGMSLTSRIRAAYEQQSTLHSMHSAMYDLSDIWKASSRKMYRCSPETMETVGRTLIPIVPECPPSSWDRCFDHCGYPCHVFCLEACVGDFRGILGVFDESVGVYYLMVVDKYKKIMFITSRPGPV